MSFISRFKDATIGFSGYPRLAREKSGGFGYIALLLLVVMAISAWISTVQLSRAMATAIPQLEAAPDFALANGQLRFDGPMPYRVADSVVIDTTGKTTEADIRTEGAGHILLTADTMYQVQGAGQVRSTDLRQMPYSVNKQDLLSFMPSLPRFVPFLYVLLYVGQLGFKALDAIILGGIAVLSGRITGRRVSFDLGFKLGLYAMTLPIIIQWIWPSFHTFSMAGFGIWWGLAAVYLLMGLRARDVAEAA